jgi:DNA-3-methyladenine glycosylase II
LEQILNLKDEDMRAVGLSKQKIKYIKNVAQFFKDKNLYKLKKEDWDKKSDQEIITLLTEIVGIGEWTVQMILIFKLERKDVFPINDLGVQVGFAKMFDLEEFRINNKKEFLKKMLEEAEKEKPYRSDFAKSLWKVKDSK